MYCYFLVTLFYLSGMSLIFWVVGEKINSKLLRKFRRHQRDNRRTNTTMVKRKRTKRTSNDLQNLTQKTKKWAKWTLIKKTRVIARRVSSSCSKILIKIRTFRLFVTSFYNSKNIMNIWEWGCHIFMILFGQVYVVRSNLLKRWSLAAFY